MCGSGVKPLKGSMERLLEKFGLYVGHLKDSTSSAKNSAARGTLQ